VTPGDDRSAPRLVEEVRRFGLVSADLIVDRYVRLTEQTIDGSPRNGGAPPSAGIPASSVPGLAEGTAALAGGWLRLLEGTAALADSALAGGTPLGTLELPPTDAGLSAEGSLWLHNTTSSPRPVEFAATTLAAPGGCALPADAVSLSPSRLDPSGPRSSTEIRVRVRVPGGQPPGHYQGLLLSSAAEQPVLLRLEVRATDGRGP
jgi:hypothetical protein